MSKQKVSKEEKENMQRGEDLRRLTESKEWGLVKEIFFSHVNDLQSIRNVTAGDDLEKQIYGRQAALEYMLDFWREVNGSVEQHSMDMYNKYEGETQNSDYDNDSDYVKRM